MRKLTLLLTLTFCVSTFAQAQKNVAVLEIDRRPEVAEEISRAEAMEITGAIRGEAVRTLPHRQFNIMTSETVQAMGGAALAECFDETCVIAIGRTIDADYVMRGVLSKFRAMFTLNIEMFETEYGNLVATSEPVRSENLEDLLNVSGFATAEMLEIFLERHASQSVAQTTPTTTQTTTQTPTTPPTPTTTPTRRTLDLDRLLGDDEYTDIFEDEPDVVAADSIDESIAQDGVTDTSNIATIDPEHADSIAANERITNAIENITTPPVVVNRAALDGDPIIEDGRTINFAQNLQGYRSPRVAMLLSLLVPGLGQWYARNNTKAAAFAGVEVAGIVTAIILNSTANSKRDDAYRFADTTFDVERMRAYHQHLEREFNERIDALPILEDTNAMNNTLAMWDEAMENALAPYLTRITREDSTFHFVENDFYDAARRGSSFFYTSIGQSAYTPGWSDNEPTLAEIINAFDNDRENPIEGQHTGSMYLSATAGGIDFDPWFYLVRRLADPNGGNIRGYSNNQQRYNDMIDEANGYRDAMNYVFIAMIVNHIVSAIDAGFTARSYNARLLNEETVFDRISVEQQFVFTGKEVSPGIALRIRF